jgi:uncharacterized metal-binding protein
MVFVGRVLRWFPFKLMLQGIGMEGVMFMGNKEAILYGIIYLLLLILILGLVT